MEDNYEDIIHKAQLGLRLSNTQLAQKAKITEEALIQAKQGLFEEETTRKLAPALNLHTESLIQIGLQSWKPLTHSLKGLIRHTSLFGNMAVNAFLVYDPLTHLSAIFDTGTDSLPIIKDIQKLSLTVKYLFLTHTHQDHILEMKRIKQTLKDIVVYVNEEEPIEEAKKFEDGRAFTLGNLTIDTLLTSGHSPGGTTYFIKGLEKPVAIIGDALFAGSIGGAPHAYGIALENIRSKILSLPNDTILCPGHGPLTTVQEEKKHNPFFPEYKK